MPWGNQNGGNNGGPWHSGPGPWGQGSGGGPPAEVERILRGGQDRLKNVFKHGGFNGFTVGIFLLVGIAIWLLTGFYTVQSNEVALNQVFGRYVGKAGPGLNYNFPYPAGSVVTLKVLDQNATDVGFVSHDDGRRSGTAFPTDVPEESLMLTGDENIADVKFRVIWQIDPAHPDDYAFNIRNPDETVKAVAESAMREVVGRSQIQRILTAERTNVELSTRDLMERVLNSYQAGVLIRQVQLLSVDPPPSVIDAFKAVTAADQEKQRLSNEAEAYANRVVLEAQGQAAAIIQQAEGYRDQTIAEAKGQTAQFDQVYAQYKKSPVVTRERLYLETMERVLGGADKIILDPGQGTNLLPLLPLTGPGQSQGEAK
ncbi:FtsH protease activity modulator HflK [Methylovirgula sp. 4M-Z18]|uniref:FtsH protease activity modulator HflK n=1 Tax=Methylovirgula sp. 4M-Z18 TaxID=2293567 RepID=UPI000E2ED53A|nr:FtsH protease activity modulator HflK [Methylovirgula sp. 4M-Z18]RFB75060.1 FtsH protease activity modulator HflK [Methylovirgula sp. 4M-Z18]